MNLFKFNIRIFYATLCYNRIAFNKWNSEKEAYSIRYEYIHNWAMIDINCVDTSMYVCGWRSIIYMHANINFHFFNVFLLVIQYFVVVFLFQEVPIKMYIKIKRFVFVFIFFFFFFALLLSNSIYFHVCLFVWSLVCWKGYDSANVF